MAKMFNTPKEDSMTSQPTTVIGDGVRVEGKCTGTGNVTVRGEVVGTLKTSDDLMIEATARVEADVEANNLTVAGEIHGNVTCHGQLQLMASGKIFGDVSTNILSVETGAILKGQCTTGSHSEAAAA
jgi:cytoskeletal protein CcmA (bactofilin family)